MKGKWKRIWLYVMQDSSGTVLMEKKAILIVAVIGVFGLSALMLPWLQGYWNDTGDSIKNAGKPNSFRSVTYK
ncbi:hypothetical protein EMIT07CA2_550014 [Brevibacillus sp. IT-7CA2]|uniref:hypothetical protein n=1 Tax=Brevibacillus sp. IT-7CA2 TaxID=3026436 RepID=UPI0039DF8FA7